MNQEKDKKSSLLALLITLLLHCLVALLLWLMHFGLTKIDEESGIMVMVGVDAQGGGEELMSSDVTDLHSEPQPETVDPAPAAVSAPTPTPAPVTPPTLTQDDDTAPFAAAEEEKKQKEQQEQERQRQIAEAERRQQEQLRRQQEEEARRKAEEEARRKAEEEAKRQAIQNQMAGMFNNNGSGGSSGLQGQANGNSTSGAASGNPGYGDYDLGGRGIMGSLPRPSFNRNISGKVVLQVAVNAQGHVVGEPKAIQGTTISDREIREAAIEAAKRARFKPIEGTSIVVGKITYYFDSNN